MKRGMIVSMYLNVFVRMLEYTARTPLGYKEINTHFGAKVQNIFSLELSTPVFPERKIIREKKDISYCCTNEII